MIGMGSIITKKIIIKPGFVYAGNPAKIKFNTYGIKLKVKKMDILNETRRFKEIIKKHPLYG